MIKELSELGKKLRNAKTDNEWIHDALKEEPVSIEIVIFEDGTFEKFNPFEKKMTIAEAITAKKGKARLLIDKAEEVLNYGGKESEKKHSLFLEKLSQYKELKEIQSVISFYEGNKSNGVDRALENFEAAIPEKERKSNIGFRIESRAQRVHEHPAILRKVIENYETMQKEALEASAKYCSVCGKNNYPVGDIPHGMIKKVPDGQSSGSALVSYNDTAFESYELKGNENSSICTNCAKTYVEGLNWLLSNGNEVFVKDKKGKEKKEFRYSNRKKFGSDTAMVFWTGRNRNPVELDYLEEPTPEDVARLIESIPSGAEHDSRHIDPEPFYSCTLSGSAARISVRDWIEISLFDLRKAIAKWFQDVAIDAYDGDLKDTKVYYPRLYDLARSCQRSSNGGGSDKDDASLARIATQLWNVALKNSIPPLWILAKVIQRSCLDKYGVSADRASLIKMILNRHNKGGDFMITEKVEKGKRPVAYVCGQIFAKLESIQYAALGDRNAGIRERYFTYAMTLPSAAFGRLFDLHSKHYTKLKNEKPGLAVNMDKELQELVKDVDINKLPATFLLEEKGQFAIGYYHQKQDQFSTNKEKDNKEGKPNE